METWLPRQPTSAGPEPIIEMLTAYFDESGTHDQAVVTTVAGFVSTEEAWRAFANAWNAVLGLWQLTHFHMSEFAHFKGQYERFRTDEEGRRLILTGLATVIQRTCFYACATSVIRKDHARLNPENRLGSAYSLAAKSCMALVRSWMQRKGIQPPVRIVLDAGCKFSHALGTELERDERPAGELADFGGEIGFETDENSVGLQAADFLAYEQCKYFTECVKADRAVPPRFSLRMLMSVPHDWKLYDLHAVADLLTTVVLNDLRASGKVS